MTRNQYFLWTALGIRTQERATMAFLLGQAFLVGVAYIFLYAPSNALFLVAFSPDSLAYAYVVTGLVVSAFGLGFIYLDRHLPFVQLVNLTLIFLAGVTLAFYVGILTTQAAWIYFALVVWVRVLWVMANLALWELAARLLDLQQSKRLFAPLFASTSLAIILGGFSSSFLISLMGTSTFLLFSVLALLLAVAAMFYAGSNLHPAEGTSLNPPPLNPVKELLGLLQNRYAQLIFGLQIGIVMIYNLLDFAFVSQAERFFRDAEGLTSFFAIVLGLTTFLVTIAAAFWGGRFLSHYGLEAGLRLEWLTVGGMLVLTALFGTFVDTGALFFALLIAAKIADETIARAVTDSALMILYQPMNPQERVMMRVAVDTIIASISISLVGALLIILEQTGFSDILLLVYLGIGLTLGLFVLSSRIYSHYRDSLTRAITRRLLSDSGDAIESTTLKLLTTKLQSSYLGEVIYALRMLEQHAPERLVELCPPLLEHSHPGVRSEVLLIIERLRPASLIQTVRRRVAMEDDATVRALAVRAQAALSSVEHLHHLLPYLNSSDPRIKAGAITGLLKYGGLKGVLLAGEKLLHMSQSPDPIERGLSADILANIGVSEFYDPLLKLLQDEVHEVRRSAINAAGILANPTLWPLVADNLAVPALRSSTAQALIRGGEGVIPELAGRFDEQNVELSLRVARIYGRIRHGAAVEHLLRWAQASTEPYLSYALMEALSLCRYQAEGEAAEMWLQQIRQQSRQAAWLLACLHDLSLSSPLLAEALLNELEWIKKRLFLLLSFLYDPLTILQIQKHLTWSSQDKESKSIETLTMLLPLELRRLVLPLLAENDPAEQYRQLQAPFPQTEASIPDRLYELILSADISAWLKACAIFASRQYEDDRYPLVIRACAGSLQALLRETALDYLGERNQTVLLTLEKVLILKDVLLFADIPDDLIAKVADTFQEVILPANHVIFEKGDIGTCMYVVVQGEVRIYEDKRTIAHYRTREVFGEMSLLDAEPRVASAITTTETHLLSLEQDIFYEFMADYPEFMRGIILVLSRRLRQQTKYLDIKRDTVLD
jgi:HEAT repeat protein